MKMCMEGQIYPYNVYLRLCKFSHQYDILYSRIYTIVFASSYDPQTISF